jgi:hypothetical protein
MRYRRVALLILAGLPELLPLACTKATRVPPRDAAAEVGADTGAKAAVDASVADSWLQSADIPADLVQDAPSVPSDAVSEATTGAAELVLDRDSAVVYGYAGKRSAPVVFTVKNRGSAASGQLQIALGGVTATDFQIASETCSSTALAVGTTCAVSVAYSPSPLTIVDGNATLTITDTGTGASVSAMLQGSRCDPAQTMTLTGGSDLGSVAPGALGPEVLFTVTNIGSGLCGALTIVVVSVSNSNIAISSDTCTGTAHLLNSGDTCMIGLRLAPKESATPQTVSASLTISSDHAAASAAATGKIVSGEPPTANPTSINFGSVPVNQPSAVKTVTLANNGSTPTGPLSVTLSGTGAGQVSIVGNTCKTPIQPASSCTISVQYVPAETMGINATITITDGSTSVSIAMVGVSVAAVDAGGDASVDGEN